MRYFTILFLGFMISSLHAEDLGYFCPADDSQDAHYVMISGENLELTLLYVKDGGRNLLKAEELLKLTGKAKKNGALVFGEEPFKAPYFYIPKNRVGFNFNFVDNHGEEQSFTRMSCEKL
jgi:hypothetical protein